MNNATKAYEETVNPPERTLGWSPRAKRIGNFLLKGGIVAGVTIGAILVPKAINAFEEHANANLIEERQETNDKLIGDVRENPSGFVELRATKKTPTVKDLVEASHPTESGATKLTNLFMAQDTAHDQLANPGSLDTGLEEGQVFYAPVDSASNPSVPSGPVDVERIPGPNPNQLTQ